MPKPMYVPRLSKKLDLLLRCDSTIRRRSDLARELGVQPPQISKWQSGHEHGGADMVPGHHFDRIMALFNVTKEWMEAQKPEGESDDQFFSRLERVLRDRAPRSDWETLFLEADISDRLAIRRATREPWDSGSLRGLRREAAAQEFTGDCFAVDERVYIELRAPDWTVSDGEVVAHVLLVLIEQSSEIECICPSEAQGLNDHKITAAVTTFPSDLSGGLLEIAAPAGLQSLFAILTREPLPETFYAEGARAGHPDLRAWLARVARELRGKDRSAWECLKYVYLVIDKKERLR